MGLFFFDTETTGLVDFKLAHDHSSQPYLVQLAALLTDDDGTERASMSVLVRPDGWTIPDEASAVHGITTDIAVANGVALRTALTAFRALLENADTVIGHNVGFDVAVINAARHRAGAQPGDYWPEKMFCTMRTATPVCKILHADPRHDQDYKWPRLNEAYRHFFGQELEGAHDALVDVRACRDVYLELQGLEAA